jgi:hypothetical protein
MPFDPIQIDASACGLVQGPVVGGRVDAPEPLIGQARRIRCRHQRRGVQLALLVDSGRSVGVQTRGDLPERGIEHFGVHGHQRGGLLG